jgi:hypothetical protein
MDEGIAIMVTAPYASQQKLLRTHPPDLTGSHIVIVPDDITD